MALALSSLPTAARPSSMFTSELSTSPSEHISRVLPGGSERELTGYFAAESTPTGGPVSGSHTSKPDSVASTTGGCPAQAAWICPRSTSITR